MKKLRENIYQPVKPDVNLPGLEEETLAFWKSEKIFEKSVEQNKNKPFFSFYDGPPFATGLPHYGHILAGTIKDIVPRYWNMHGYYVPRRFGWDCHGVPVEFEINKQLKLDDRKQILAYGVDKYNEACRSIVTRYANEWKKVVERGGRWVDMEDPYFTMDPGFMSSVWWVFKQLWDQKLIYEGYKVVPYSVGLSTTLSNFEANLNYKDVQDPAITVSFKVAGAENKFVLAWTTTPWTLPSNLALALGKDINYVWLKDNSSDKTYLMAEPLVPNYFSKEKGADFEILETKKGSELLGIEYEPLFPFFADKKSQGAFKTIASDHVTTESGTGIVHIAPAFGEEDFYACQKLGIPVVNPVDDDGRFTSDVSVYQGQKVKEADPTIIADLKKTGKLFRHDTITHSYPFCWRTDTPLIYRAVATWFVKVESIKDKIIRANKKTAWVPEHLRDGRFGNWLENARDWAISRNRFWGTPLPIWRNEEGEVICVSSAQELAKLSGKEVNDLHIHFVDKITLPSPTGKSPLKRIEGVLDCWFESGSMPYAQWEYPLKNQEEFKKGFPANFIAEGLDQTRGWFYTLMVIGAALFDEPPFKNVVVNGLVLAEDGKKMSKSLRNYPDPMEVLNQHGADALRLYMIDSPVVKAEELRFSEKGVRDVVRRILLRWWNSYSFFVNYANIDGFKPRGDFEKSPNVLDQWLISRLNSLIELTNREMEAFRLYNTVPQLLNFVEELTNTYIRFNRRHFWQEGMPEDKRLAYETLYHALVTLSKVMAPFAPFLSDAIYKNLATQLPNSKQSVHLEEFPKAKKEKMRTDLEQAVRRMEELVLMGRNLREKFEVKAKIPLQKLTVVHKDAKALQDLKELESYFADELNVRSVAYDSNESQYVLRTAKANFPVLGKRLGPKMKTVAAEIAKFTPEMLDKLEMGECVEAAGEKITMSDVEIRRAPKEGHTNLLSSAWVSIELDSTVTEEQVLEGLSREVIRKVQQARKNADFQLDDRISLELHCEGDMKKAVELHGKRIQDETLSLSLKLAESPSGEHSETFDVDGDIIKVGVKRV